VIVSYDEWEFRVSELDEVVADAAALDLDRPPSLRGSGEVLTRTTTHGAARWISALLALIAVAAAAGGAALIQSHVNSWLAPAILVTSAFFLISSVAVPLAATRENGVEKAATENCQQDCEDLYWALDCIENRTIKRLAWVNFKQLRAFTVIAQRQARMSYYSSLIAAGISLLVLIAGAAVAIGSPATSAKVIAGILATVGTTLSGFLAKIFLKTYQMASAQMGYYYGQPLVHCYLLHAEWLASEAGEHLDDAEKTRLLEKVVSASIKSSAEAQSHLLSMQRSNQKRRGKKPANQPGNHQSEPELPRPSASYSGQSFVG
jgi:hypothetical protein